MLQPDQTRKTPKETAPAKQDVTDRVEISLEARARLAELADRELKERSVGSEDRLARPEEPTGGARDRISEIRQKIESGYYDRPEIRDQIIDRLTDDLGL